MAGEVAEFGLKPRLFEYVNLAVALGQFLLVPKVFWLHGRNFGITSSIIILNFP